MTYCRFFFQKAECLRSAVDLTGRLLTQCGQGLGKVNTPTKHTPYTLQVSNPYMHTVHI